MTLFKKFITLLFISCSSIALADNPTDYNIRYKTNYFMPAYVHFTTQGEKYHITAKINVPLYNIEFQSNGYNTAHQFKMLNYQDIRNSKPYALAKITNDSIQYGKVNALKTEATTLPTFDLFTLAFQLSYYDKLPPNFQTTNGKKLYPVKNVILESTTKQITVKKQLIEEITYQFKTGNKYITVKKFAGEKFPRYISYSRDGDEYELKFDRFID